MKRVLKISIITIVVAGSIMGAAYAGFRYGNHRSVSITDSKQLINSDFNLFWEAVDIAKSNYVDMSGVTDEKLLYGAIKGMLGAIDDPYTVFFNPSDAKKFEQDLNGSFGGIGAEIGIRSEQLLVISPLKGNPAEAAGLRPMDKIWKVNDKETAGLSVEESVKLIRGEPGTKVTLSIFRDGWREAKDFVITRAVIQVPTLDSEIKTTKAGKKIAVMRLYNFNANVPSLFYTAATNVLTGGAEGIVLDLRNNPGGFLDVATNLAGYFVESGKTVVKEKKRGGEEELFVASGNALLSKLPIVVLINSGSASASEILAGAIKDLRGAQLIGEKSFGKGSVQKIETMSNGSTLKVTIAHWYTPNDTKIDKVGLKPDVEVKMTDEDFTKQRDPQMDKAMEVIEKEIK